MAILLILTSQVYASGGSGQEGNGGAVVKRNGRLMTYYSAGVVVDPTGEKTRAEIPGLESLLDFIAGSEFFSPEQVSKLMLGIIPTNSRHYYKVDENYFTPEVKQRLIAEHSRVSGEPIDELRLACLTDTNTGTTFLLPNFYELSPNDQITMLIHEALWMLFPKADYTWIDSVEIAFQAYLEDAKNVDKALRFISKISNPIDLFKLVILRDERTGILKDGQIFSKDGSMPITIRNLLGDGFMNCATKINTMYEAEIVKCQPLLRYQAMKLAKTFPESAFIGFWNTRMSSERNVLEFFKYSEPHPGDCALILDQPMDLKGMYISKDRTVDMRVHYKREKRLFKEELNCEAKFDLYLGDERGLSFN